MKLWKALAAMLLPVLALLSASCSSTQVLDIRPYHLREIGETDEGDDPMLRGDYQRRMYGAIGVKEQGERLGYYYTVLYNDSGTGPGKVVFEFQQGLTASRVKKMTQDIPAGKSKGRAEFAIIGQDYQKGGKVLAWRCKLYREGREVASRQSYLWR